MARKPLGKNCVATIQPAGLGSDAWIDMRISREAYEAIAPLAIEHGIAPSAVIDGLCLLYAADDYEFNPDQLMMSALRDYIAHIHQLEAKRNAFDAAMRRALHADSARDRSKDAPPAGP